MRRRIEKRFLPSQSLPGHNVVADGAEATIPSPVKLDETAELAQVNVLYSFLENRYGHKVGFSLDYSLTGSMPLAWLICRYSTRSPTSL